MMLRFLYRALLRLRPREWRAEMLGVFDQAAADARALRRAAYLRFGLREMAGLLRVERGGWLRWALGGALAGLLAGWAVTAAAPEMYTAHAKIAFVPGAIPERYVPSRPGLASETFPRTLQEVLSRRSLINLIQTYDLYRPERARMPLEDVLELMQKQVEILPFPARLAGAEPTPGRGAVRVSFSYRDPVIAQKVTRDLMTRLIDDTIKERTALSMMTVGFLRAQADRAATAWEELNGKARNAAGPGAERLQLDRDLARKRYQTLREQVIEAEMISDMDEHKEGPTVEVLDLPSLPERPELSHMTILGAAAGVGLLLGLLAVWLRKLRRGAPALAAASLH